MLDVKVRGAAAPKELMTYAWLVLRRDFSPKEGIGAIRVELEP